jgi:hypothetical protein
VFSLWHGLPAHVIAYNKHGQDGRATKSPFTDILGNACLIIQSYIINTYYIWVVCDFGLTIAFSGKQQKKYIKKTSKLDIT